MLPVLSDISCPITIYYELSHDRSYDMGIQTQENVPSNMPNHSISWAIKHKSRIKDALWLALMV